MRRRARRGRLRSMCRLFARIAAEPHPAVFGLLETDNSLEAQSRREPDGYGIGTFDKEGRPHVIKRAKAAYEDAGFPAEAHELRSAVFLAHIRFATNGANAERNTHPFIQDGRIFAHNGVVHGLDELEARLRPEYLGLVKGETDSERVFALVTQETADHGGDVTAGLTAAARWIAASLPLYALNVLVGTPEAVWALRYPETHGLLWFDDRDGHVHGDRHDRRHRLRVGIDEPVPGIGIASEPIGPQEGWRMLEPGQLLHVGPGLEPRVTTILDGPPARPLTLADLDVHAVAAQQET
jgi:glutamine amidotransferase